MMIEELCKKLRPLYGEAIDRFWQVYLIEDADGKRELEQTVRLLYAQTFTNAFEEESVLVPPPKEKAMGAYPIGQITYAEKELYPFSLREDDWLKHMLIVGASGSGKTNTVFQILKNFLLKKKPFLVLDWKRNYRDLLEQDYGRAVRVFTVGRDISPFRFNPLIPPPGTPAQTWLKKLIEIIAHATFVGEGVMYLLQRALDETYRHFGMYEEIPPTRYPTLSDVLATVEQMEARGREAGWLSSTLRALGALTFGETGKIFSTRQPSSMASLLKESVILELDALTNTDKIFLVESLLLWIHHYRLSSPEGQRECFEHAIVLEEAHHVIGKDKSDLVGGEAITDVIIREIRELGESVIIIDQCPSLLSLPARANTWCTLVLNLKDAKDVQSAASAILLEAKDKRMLGRLDVGQAVVKLQGRWHHPFTLTIPHIPIAKGSVSDDMLRPKTGSDSGCSGPERGSDDLLLAVPPNEAVRKITLGISPTERLLLEDIQQHPFAGVVERYKRLGWSRRKGNAHKQSLLQKQLIASEEVPTRSGRVVVLKWTHDAYQIVGQDPPQGQAKRPGGIQHEYWKAQYAQRYRAMGYEVTEEYPLGEGKAVDLVAEKGAQRVAIEVETGRSDPVANVEKCQAHGFDRILLIATTEKAQRRVQKVLQDSGLLDPDSIEIQCARQSG